MTGLDFDDSDKRRFNHYASGYGVVLHGSTPENRENALREQLNDPLVVIDCRENENMDEIHNTVILQTGHRDEEELERLHIGPVDMKRAIVEQNYNVLVVEIDELPDETRTSLAQFFKGLGERRNFDGQIGYTAKEPDSVVQAQPDLRGRLRAYELDE